MDSGRWTVYRLEAWIRGGRLEGKAEGLNTKAQNNFSQRPKVAKKVESDLATKERRGHRE